MHRRRILCPIGHTFSVADINNSLWVYFTLRPITLRRKSNLNDYLCKDMNLQIENIRNILKHNKCSHNILSTEFSKL